MSFASKRSVLGSEFLRNNAIYFSAAVAVGALNYLYYPVLGRMLNPSAFGEVQTLVSLFLQALAYLMVMSLVTVHIVANRKNAKEANKTISELERLATFIAVGLLLLLIAFSGSLQRYFQFEQSLPFILLGLAIVISVPYMIRSAYVNGKKLFGLNAWSSITAAGGKLVLSAALVAIGWGVGGAIAGIIIAQAIALILAAHFAKRHGFKDIGQGTVFRRPDIKRIRPELPYAGLVLVGSLGITILYSVDVIVVKHFFDPHTAGLYASVATVARILFFLTVPIAQVLMPTVKVDAEPSVICRAVLKSTFLMTAIGSVVLAAFWLAPEIIVTTLMGQECRTYAGLLPKLGLAIFIISILNLITTYYMALRVYTVGAIVAGGAFITYVIMNANHQSLEAVVNSLLVGTLIMSGMFVIWSGLRGPVRKNKLVKRRGEAKEARAWQQHNSYQ